MKLPAVPRRAVLLSPRIFNADELTLDDKTLETIAAGSPHEVLVAPEEELEPQVEPLEASLSHFWEIRGNLGGFRVAIGPPPVETALLKRLGPPSFSRRPEAFIGALTLAYATVTDRALALAFGEDQPGGSEIEP